MTIVCSILILGVVLALLSVYLVNDARREASAARDLALEDLATAVRERESANQNAVTLQAANADLGKRLLARSDEVEALALDLQQLDARYQEQIRQSQLHLQSIAHLEAELASSISLHNALEEGFKECGRELLLNAQYIAERDLEVEALRTVLKVEVARNAARTITPSI